MQKNFYWNKAWQYFYQGFQISDDERDIYVSETAFNDSILFERLNAPSLPKTELSISAIVGKNGTGKSTVIELLIRMVNNLSAAIYGEYPIYSAAEHLHYIDHVYAKLCYLAGGQFFILSVEGRNISLRKFNTIDSYHHRADKSDRTVLDPSLLKDEPLLSKNPDNQSPIQVNSATRV